MIELNKNLTRAGGNTNFPMIAEQENTIKALTNDGHERVEVADIEAFPCHVDEELDDASSVLFLHRLHGKQRKAIFIMQVVNARTHHHHRKRGVCLVY